MNAFLLSTYLCHMETWREIRLWTVFSSSFHPAIQPAFMEHLLHAGKMPTAFHCSLPRRGSLGGGEVTAVPMHNALRLVGAQKTGRETYPPLQSERASRSETLTCKQESARKGRVWTPWEAAIAFAKAGIVLGCDEEGMKGVVWRRLSPLGSNVCDPPSNRTRA